MEVVNGGMAYFAAFLRVVWDACAGQSILIEVEVLMVRVAMQLMAGQVVKASSTIRKVIKSSYWLLQVSTEVAASS